MKACKKVVVSLVIFCLFFTSRPFPSLYLESRSTPATQNDFSVNWAAQNSAVGAGSLFGLSFLAFKCIKSFFTSINTTIGVHAHPVTPEFHHYFKQRDSAIYNFFTLALQSNDTTQPTLQARLDLLHFNTSTINAQYGSAIESIKQQLVNIYFSGNGQLRSPVRTEQLGAIFDPFLRTYFEHDEYMVALKAIGDTSAIAIFDYHHSSPFGHAVRGTGLVVDKLQSIIIDNHCSIAQAMQHPYNQALQKLMDCCNNKQFEQARMYLQPGDQAMQQLYDNAYTHWYALTYNEHGILRAHETDHLWQQLSPDAKNTLAHNPLQRESFNKLLMTRELYREFVYARYGINRAQCSAALKNTIEDMVELQTTLQFNIRSGIDFMIMKSENSEVAQTFFDTTSGIVKDFNTDPIIGQLKLNCPELLANKDAQHCANYFLAVRASDAPSPAKHLATCGLEAIATQLSGKSVHTDAVTVFDKLCEQFPQVVGADYHAHLIDTQEFHTIVERIDQMPFSSHEQNGWAIAVDRFKRDGDFRINQNFAITNEGKVLLLESHISVPQYEFIRGNALQRELHKNLVDNINEVGALHAQPAYQQTRDIHITLAQLNQTGVEKTKQNEIKTGLNILFICKQGVQYIKAVAGGVADGAVLAAHDIKNNPLGFAASAVVQLYAGSTLVTYQVLKAAYDVGGIAGKKLSEVNFQELTAAGIVDSLKKVGAHFADRLQHMPSPDAVRKAVATGTHIYLDYKATKAVANLYKHALNTTKFAVIKLNNVAKQPTRINQKNLLSTQRRPIAVTPEGIEIYHPESNNNNFFKIEISENSRIPKGPGLSLDNPLTNITKDPNRVIKSIEIPANYSGIIKKFDIIEKMLDHTFSPKHVNAGLLKNLGGSKIDILETIANKIMKADCAGNLKEEMNQFITTINGHEITIRCFIKQGEILMTNAFIGKSERIIGNYFEL